MKPLKDVDAAGRLHQMQVTLWSLIGGAVFALPGALKFGRLGLLIGWLLGAVLIYVVCQFLAGRVGTAVSSVYMTSGSSTPAKREYSLGDALAAQGKLAEAVTEFARCATLYPQDAEPRLRIARLKRDRMQQPQESAHWFRQALQVPSLDPAHESALLRELSELYVHKLRDPASALPFLARLAERQAQSPSGEWARREIADIKRQMREHGD